MKNVHMGNIRVTEGNIEILKKEGKMRISTIIFMYTLHFALGKCTQNFMILNQVFAEKTWTKKGTDMQYVAVFCYTIQLITIKLCTKFQNPKSIGH